MSGSSSLGPDPLLQECSELSTISSRSDQLLESLQEHCHHLAAEVERAERVLEAAKQAQEDLFHSLQDVSFAVMVVWVKYNWYCICGYSNGRSQ